MPTSVEAALTWIGVFLVLAGEGYLLDRDERLSVNPTMSYRHGPLISEDESDLFSGVVVGIGPRRKRDLDTRVRVRLDANGKQISVPAPAISLGKS